MASIGFTADVSDMVVKVDQDDTIDVHQAVTDFGTALVDIASESKEADVVRKAVNALLKHDVLSKDVVL